MRLLLLLVVPAFVASQDDLNVIPLSSPVVVHDSNPQIYSSNNHEYVEQREYLQQDIDPDLLELENYHLLTQNGNLNNQKLLLSIEENPVDDFKIVESGQLDDTVEKLCAKETQKILTIWNVIASHLGLSSSSYSISDTSAVRRLYTIIQTFMALSRKEDFNNMSIRRILEIIQEHLKKNPNSYWYKDPMRQHPDIEIPKKPIEYIVPVPETGKESDNPQIEIIISENQTPSDEHFVVNPIQPENIDLPPDFVQVPNTEDIKFQEIPTLPPYLFPSSEAPPVINVDVVQPITEEIRPIYDETQIHTIVEEGMYPNPISIDVTHNEYQNKVQSYYSISIWHQLLRLYGRCPASRVLLMQVKALIDTLNRQHCY